MSHMVACCITCCATSRPEGIFGHGGGLNRPPYPGQSVVAGVGHNVRRVFASS